MPMEDFMDADFFLFLLSQALPDSSGFGPRYWRAWSCLYLNQVPVFIRNAERKAIAEELAKLLGVQDIEGLKEFIKENGHKIRPLFGTFWDYPIEQEDINRIGSR